MLKWPEMGQRCSVKRSVNSAAIDGAKLPETVTTGMESSRGIHPTPTRKKPRVPKNPGNAIRQNKEENQLPPGKSCLFEPFAMPVHQASRAKSISFILDRV
jgi:hypothetical protein